jgi:hypothetical protein
MKRRERQHNLVVEYEGGIDQDKDKLIVKLVGRPEDGSGFCFMDGSRDLSFGFATRRGAEGAMGRVKAVLKRAKYRIYTEKE